jgi:hypothetical protein
MNLKYLIEQVLGGLAKGKSLKQIAKQKHTPLKKLKKEFKKGEKVEQEHVKKTNVSKKTKKKTAGTIAKDHLIENPKYYTKLEKIEKKK